MLVSAIAAIVFAAAIAVFPDRTAGLLSRFGGPSRAVVAVLCGVVLVWAFSSFFLYGILDARGAALTLRTVVVGFFVASVVGVTGFRGRMVADPTAFLWPASVAVYGTAALVGVALILRSDAFRGRGPVAWNLPEGFWTAAFYTHLQTLVAFAYMSLSPMIVLLWLDLNALGYFHAALRFPVLLTLMPIMVASVTGPAVAAQEAVGRRADAFRQVGRTLDAAWAATVPACIILAAFAPDVMRVFGPGYPAHAGLLRILTLTAVAAPVAFIGASIAVALNAFREYFRASVFFLVATVGFSLLLVPRLGLTGAALAAALGAFVQHAAIAALLKSRFGFALSSRSRWAWGWTAAVAAVAWLVQPGRPAAALLAVAGISGFLWTAGVDRAEITDAVRKLKGGA
jgi:O-antigen/teichoic acid export membrane protein